MNRKKAMTVRLTEEKHNEIMKYCIDLKMSFNEYVNCLLKLDERLQDEIHRIADLDQYKHNEDVLEALQLISCYLTEEMIPTEE